MKSKMYWNPPTWEFPSSSTPPLPTGGAGLYVDPYDYGLYADPYKPMMM